MGTEAPAVSRIEEVILDSPHSKAFHDLRREIKSLPKKERIQRLKATLIHFHLSMCLFDTDRVDSIRDKASAIISDIDYGNFPKRKVVSVSTKRALMERFLSAGKLTCHYCLMRGSRLFGPDGKKWTIDHKRPVTNGGSNSEDNLAVSCATCNQLKSTTTYDVFVLAMGMLPEPLLLFLNGGDQDRRKAVRETIDRAREIVIDRGPEDAA